MLVVSARRADLDMQRAKGISIISKGFVLLVGVSWRGLVLCQKSVSTRSLIGCCVCDAIGPTLPNIYQNSDLIIIIIKGTERILKHTAINTC